MLRQPSLPAGSARGALLPLGAAVLLLLLFAACAEPDPEPSPPLGSGPILLVGMDGLEWRVLLPMMRDGQLPVLRRLMQEGIYGALATLKPTRSPAIWTSIATGKMPEKHGIQDGVLKDPEDQKLRIARRTDRKTKAVWNIYSDFGLRVHSIGWWMTFPTEPISGVMTAQMNWMFQFSPDGSSSFLEKRRRMKGMVSPLGFQERVMDIALGTYGELPHRLRSIFGAAAEEPHSPLGRKMWDSGRWVVTVDGIHLAVAREILDRREPFDLMLVYLRGADVLSHNFWRFAYPDDYENPPDPEDVTHYSTILPDYYRFLDESLGVLIQSVREDATVILVSDHGMETGNRSGSFDPTGKRMDILSGGHEEAPPGVLIAAGPRIRQVRDQLDLDAISYEILPDIGSILDVTPTVLALRGLPVGEDMDGRALAGIFDDSFRQAVAPAFVASHDALGKLDLEEEHALTPEEAQDRLEELRSLGYVE